MTTSTWGHPSLWRVVVWAILFGLVANVFLWWIVSPDDEFARIIAVASGITAALLLVAWFTRSRWVDEILLIAFAVWVANATEFALQDGPQWETQVRQCGLYVSEALLALGAYVAHRQHRAT